MPSLIRIFVTAFALAILTLDGEVAYAAFSQVEANFNNPPNSARPRVWWHWMNGNVTEYGIALDLQWMKRIGIGGVHNFDGAFWGTGHEVDTPIIVQRPLTYMSAEWWRA